MTTNIYIRLAAVLLTVLLTVPVDARTLVEYAQEVSHLREDFAVLIGNATGNADEDAERFEGEVFEEVREFSADKDPILFNGTEFTPKNGWFLERLNELTAGSKAPDERINVLYAIYERLGALEGKIIELQEAKEGAPSKDENKRALSEILSREEFSKKPDAGDESLAARILKQLEEWFRYLFPQREPASLPASRPDAFVYVIQLAVYAAAAAVVLFLLIRILPGFLKRRRRARKGKKEGRVVLGEKIGPDKTVEDLFAEAEALAGEGRLREGLRKAYIALLFGLGEKRIIGLAKHKTNRDYLNDMKKTRDLHSIVTGLTVQFERHWYGTVETGSEDWERFAEGYKEAIGTAGKRVV